MSNFNSNFNSDDSLSWDVVSPLDKILDELSNSIDVGNDNLELDELFEKDERYFRLLDTCLNNLSNASFSHLYRVYRNLSIDKNFGNYSIGDIITDSIYDYDDIDLFKFRKLGLDVILHAVKEEILYRKTSGKLNAFQIAQLPMHLLFGK